MMKVCETLDVSPSDCVYVGDAPSDGMAAKAAGMAAIGVIWGANSEEVLRASNSFDYICSTVDELRKVVPRK
jgi:phosphoglycolate phosphatase-like HAD superfamily hydrolase